MSKKPFDRAADSDNTNTTNQCQFYRSDSYSMNTLLNPPGCKETIINPHQDNNVKKLIPKTTLKKYLTAHSLKPRGSANSNLQSHSQKTIRTQFHNNSNNLFNLTQKSSFRVIDSNDNNVNKIQYPKISVLRSKYSTAKIYLSIKKPQAMNWEPHCLQSISTTSIVPNPDKVSLSFSSRNLFNKSNKSNIKTAFDYLKLNDELIRTDQKKKSLYRKRRYLQDFGLGTIKITYQINQLIIVIEPFSSFTLNVYLLVICDDANLSSIEKEFCSFDRLVSSLSFDESNNNFIINKNIKQFKYTTQIMSRQHYYSSSLEKEALKVI